MSKQIIKRGRPSIHGKRKRSYSVSVTQEGWDALKKMAKESGLSLSEFLEILARTKRIP
ncbi:hypothetical protein [Moorena sp. SIO4G3]|uniref:hypothetical protein n=1 Tax=Moorena sp. SIO4G3 TaxID=2607821 RepID=UPI00142998EA|nr:hypothetical protein [Moorena sp. SIO4G3]NEO82548.1 ribbon-helix-helix domain-containing protein [Moorena sp. SIO4G3]